RPGRPVLPATASQRTPPWFQVGATSWEWPRPGLLNRLRRPCSPTYSGGRARTPIPAWVAPDQFPPTDGINDRIAVLGGEIDRLRGELTEAEALREKQRAMVGLLYESGEPLEDLVADALNELGVALGEAVGDEEYTAL